MNFLHVFTLAMLACVTPVLVDAQSKLKFVSAEMAIVRLEAQEDLLKRQGSLGSDEVLTTRDTSSVYDLLKLEVTLDMLGILQHQQNLPVVLDTYLTEDELYNSEVVTDTQRARIRQYLLDQLTVEVYPKK